MGIGLGVVLLVLGLILVLDVVQFDIGFIDDQGRLHWHGRMNDIIKTGGANVSPLEIDAVLRTLPGVKVVATVGIPHDTLGEMVVACVVPEEGAAVAAGFDRHTLPR